MSNDSSNGAIQPPDGTPGSENSLHESRSESMSTGDENTTITRSEASSPSPPAANQGAAEPVPSAPEESPQSSGGTAGDASDSEAQSAASAGEASRASGELGDEPRPINADAAAGAREMEDPSTAAVAGSGVPSPGGSGGVPVPSVHAARGSSEETLAAEGVRAQVDTTSLAAPGKPDGEVDTRT